MQLLSTVRNLPALYQGVLLDQFGVLHDGRRPYPGALQALEYMHRKQMKIYILSNSSQRSLTAYARLEAMGFKNEWITDIVTSGEMTHLYLNNRQGEFWENLGKKCLHFTWNKRGKIDLQDINLEVVEDLNEVEFILVHGIDALGQRNGTDPIPSTYDETVELLQMCAQLPKQPPMIVANPDFVTVDGSELTIMPGTFGRKYEAMGGIVKYMGKPGPFIYQYTLKAMELDKEKVIAIGDSIEHDVKGAEEMGIASILVCGGIHKNELMSKNGKIANDGLQNLLHKHSMHPTYYIDYFRL